MNVKSYLFLKLKQYLVLYIVSFVLFVTAAFSAFMSTRFITTKAFYMIEGIRVDVPEYGGISLGVLNSPMFPLILVLFILMLIMPIFAMGARYSLTASDTYKQVSQKRNCIRLVNNLTLLASVLIVFTLVYWLLIMAIAIKYNVTPTDTTPELAPAYMQESGAEYYTYEIRNQINFGAYALMFPFIIIFAALQYFISYLLVSRSNRTLNSVLNLVLGELALALILPGLLNVIDSIHTSLGYIDPLVAQISGSGNQSFFMPMFFLCNYFTPLIEATPETSYYYDITSAQLAVQIISFAIYFALAALGIIAMIFEKDPSGEYAGKPESDKPHQDIIFHLGAFGVGFGIACYIYGVLVAVIILEVIFVVIYFVFMGMFRRNFKPNLANLIPYIAISVLCLAIALTFAFTLESSGLLSLFA